MKGKEESASEWLRGTLLFENGKLCTTEEMDCTSQIRQIDKFVIAVSRYKGDLVEKGTGGRLQIPARGKLIYANFLACLRLNLGLIRDVFPKHRFSPYYELYERHCGDRARVWGLIHHEDAEALNGVLSALRREARANSFRAVVDNHERAARKNAVGAIRYVRALFDRYSRLRVIRLDLTYQRPHADTSLLLLKGCAPTDPVSPAEVVQHREAFLKYLREAYPALVGYIWKIEHGVYKSFHMHWIIVLNGHEAMQDEVMAKAMGDHWRVAITSGRGSYWNVNRQKSEYEKRGLLGIGEINWYQEDRRAALERIVRYLAKVDYFIRVVAPEIDRVFGRGGMPKPGNSRVGRPRGRMPGGSAAAVAQPTAQG